MLGNATALSLGAVIGQLANFGFVIFVARGFGREIFAQYSLSMAIGGLVCILVSFGSLSLISRCTSQDEAHGLEMLRSVFPVQILISIGLWIATLALGSVIAGFTENLAILACIVGYHIIVRLSDVLLTQLYGRERLDIVALIRLGRDVVALALGVTLALTTGSAVAGVMAMPLASGCFLIFSYLKVQRLAGPIPWKWGVQGAWDVARQAFPFFLIISVTAACDRLGPLMITVIQDPDALATYATGERIITFGAVLYSMLINASFPAVSRLAATDSERQLELANRLVRVILLTVMPAATLLYLFSADIIGLLFGEDFTTSVPVLQVVAWVLAVRGFNSVQTMVAIASGRQKDVLTGRCFSLALLVALGTPLIWAFGPMGLAATILAVEITYSVVLHGLLTRYRIHLSPFPSFGPVFAACLVAVAVGLLSTELNLGYRITILSGCLVAGLWVFGAIRQHDLRYLVAILLTRRTDPSGGF